MDWTTSTPTMDNLFPLPPSHFLSQPRPSGIASPSSSNNVVVDTTTLAAHDFDVDPRTGFMPPHAPIARLEGEHGVWEGVLGEACGGGFRLGGGEREERWRGRVREVSDTIGSRLKLKGSVGSSRSYRLLGYSPRNHTSDVHIMCWRG